METNKKKAILALLPITFLFIFVFRLFGDGNSAVIGSSIGGVYNQEGSQIAFFSGDGGGGQLWIMDANGSNLQNVTSGHKGDRWPQFSADGKSLVFMSNEDGDWEIFTVNIDGTNRTQISDNKDTELGASFSPDGNAIVIGSIQADTGAKNLYQVDRQGKNRKKIVGNGLWPYWSNAGATILHGHTPQTQNEFDIWAYDTNTKMARALTQHAGNNYGAKMNAQGSKVVFVSDRDGAFGLFEMTADGSDPHALNIPSIMDSSPSYAPDGKSILYTNIVDEKGTPGLFKYDFATQRTVQIVMSK